MVKRVEGLLCLCVMLLLAGCGGRDADKPSQTLKEARLEYNQGLEYDQAWQFRLAELYYGKVYRTMKENPEEDWWLYGEAGFRYAHLLSERGDLAGAVAVLGEILERVEGNDEFPSAQRSTLLSKMAYCQRKLKQYDAAKQTYAKAYEARIKDVGSEGKGIFDLVVLSDCIFLALFEMECYEDAAQWLSRADAEFAFYEQHGDSALVEEYRGLQALYHVQLLQATGYPTEAAAMYANIPRSRLLNPMGSTTAAEYLMVAGRYGEAADLYADIDTKFTSFYNSHITFDVVREKLAPRYAALRHAGRTTDALDMADNIVNAIDSALVWQKLSNAAELAVIYQTHEKELALKESKGRATLYLVLVVAALLMLLLVGYFLWRVYCDKCLLTEKNRLLYEQIIQREEAEDKGRELQQTQSVETLSQSQQIYRSLCHLMEDPAVFTDPEANRDTLARIVGTNYKYVSDALRECAGLTPADFINQYRIRYAARLLTTTDDPVGLIIEQCGFTNRSTFARLFRDHYSMSPTEFRHAAKG